MLREDGSDDPKTHRHPSMFYAVRMEGLSTKLKALADPTRLSILEFLENPVLHCCSTDEGVCACDFEDFLGLSQPTVSHHMKLLVQAGLVTAEKRGRWVFYDLNPEAFNEVTEHLARFAKTSVKAGQA